MRSSALCLSLCLAFALTALTARPPMASARSGCISRPGPPGPPSRATSEGREDIDYVLGAKAGQRMTVELHTDNPQNYFNILPPGSDEALFVGSSSGNRFEGTLPDSGDYRVRVYLMRAAARRDESANYRLDIHIDSAGAHASAGPPAAISPTGWPADRTSGRCIGVPAGDTLNLRAGPSAHDRVVGEIGNGSVLRNLGCRMPGGQRWCQVARPEDPGSQGWVAGRYLRESSYQP